MREYLKNKTIQDSIAVLSAGLALGAHSLVGFRRAAVRTDWILSPWLLPMLLSVFAVLLSAALFGEGCRETARKRADAPAAASDGRGGKKALVVALSVAAYCALLPHLRFIPATALFLAALMWYLGERRWRLIAAVALLLPLALYALFGLGLGVCLP